MTHKLTLVLALFLTVTLSCKTKKNAIKSTSPVAVKSDQEIDNIKKNLPEGSVERTTDGIKFTFNAEILFPTNSSYLNESSKKSIAEVAKVIREKSNSGEILVEGHSDKTGTSSYNLWLSEKRAISVKTYLGTLGTNVKKIRTAGLGDTKPIADNKTKEGRLINRRVEITLLKK
jgi:outer membrane protein OmpA-like peptidoglycan-associated protein